VVKDDETPFTVNVEKIATLRPAFNKDGLVTAATSSSISDGAAALVLMTESEAKKRGAKPLARIIGYASSAREPEWFTTAPVDAIKKVLSKTGWKVSDVDLFEVNEAFAVVTMAAMKDVGIAHDKVNVNGGACALGHPIGATGARIITTLIYALKKRGLKAISEPFDAEHKRLFTFALPLEHEFVALRAVVQGRGISVRKPAIARGDRNPKAAAIGTQLVYMDRKKIKATVYDRAKLKAGNRIRGPAIVIEYLAPAGTANSGWFEITGATHIYRPLGDTGGAEILIKMDDRLDVRAGPEAMTPPLKLPAQLGEVVDLAVGHDPDGLVLVGHGLVPTRQVGDDRAQDCGKTQTLLFQIEELSGAG
jgi:hypothetical protein